MYAVLRDHYHVFRLKGGTHEEYLEKYVGKNDIGEELKEIQRAYELKGPSRRARLVFDFYQRQQCDADAATHALAA